MRAWHIDQFNGVDGLTLREHDVPSPGPREVLIRVHASSINFRELMAINGWAKEWVRTGVVPSPDGAGEVIAIGPGVRRNKVGDRVVVNFYEDWIAGEFPEYGDPFGRGFQLDGLLTEYIVVNDDATVLIPEHLGYTEAATLPCAGLTAWSSLVAYAPLLPGDVVLVEGSGGVSVFAMQLAKLFGARVIATTSNETKALRMRELGADDVINYRTRTDWDQEVMRLTSGRGADLVVDIGGAETIARSIAAARSGGRISMTGLLTGSPQSGLANANAYSGRGILLHPIRVGNRQQFEQMNRAISQHRMKPVIDQIFPFEHLKEAVRYLESRQHIGKVVIRHS